MVGWFIEIDSYLYYRSTIPPLPKNPTLLGLYYTIVLGLHRQNKGFDLYIRLLSIKSIKRAVRTYFLGKNDQKELFLGQKEGFGPLFYL